MLIQVKAIGVNPLDVYIRLGRWDPMGKLCDGECATPCVQFPYTPGNDAAGLVVAVGPDVTSVKVLYFNKKNKTTTTSS